MDLGWSLGCRVQGFRVQGLKVIGFQPAVGFRALHLDFITCPVVGAPALAAVPCLSGVFTRASTSDM